MNRLITAPTAEPIHKTEAKTHLRVSTTDDDTYIDNLIKVARSRAEDITGRALVLQTREEVLDNFPGTDYIRLPYAPLRSIVSLKYTDSDGTETTWGSSNYIADTDSEPGRLALAYGVSWPSFTPYPYNAVRVRYKCGYATPFTVNETTDVLTATGHTYSDADIVRLWNTGGALSTGMSADTDYHVRDTVAAVSMKLATSAGGAAADFTGNETGTCFFGVIPEEIKQAMLLMIGHWYENREAVITGFISKNIEMAVEALLAQKRINWSA